MANLVNLEAVGKSYGTRTVLAGVSLGVADRDRIGVVGVNGGGKSTLLRMITGAEAPDSGRVTRAGGTTVAYVDQRGDLPAGASVRQAVVGDAAEHEWAGDAAVRAVLSGLGLPDVGLDAGVDRLSGGERRRVALAAALVIDAELLVLDEPTNHLDVEAITWLAGHLAHRTDRRGALIVVTHDRWLLDEVCTGCWEVGEASVRQFDGGYAAYTLARAERARQSGATEARRQNLLRKELAWLRRGAPARTAKPRFRIDAAEALIADVPSPRDRVELIAIAQRRLGRQVFDLEGVTLRVGDRVLLDDVTWHVGPGERIGVIGVNGSGKTHLLRLLAGEIAPTAGRIRVGSTVRAAHLSQELDELPADRRVIDAIEQVSIRAVVAGVEQSAGQLAQRFGFAGDAQFTPVADLSGGQRRRLQMLRLLLTEPNVLLLDEPTNDLDIDTLTLLEDLLDSWPGTLIVVSHDRYLIERVCDSTQALLGDGSLAFLPGGVEQYLAQRANRAAAAAEDAVAARRRKGDSRQVRRDLVRLEREIDRLSRREAQLHEQLATQATNYAAVAELDAELRSVTAQRGAAEDAWLELSDE